MSLKSIGFFNSDDPSPSESLPIIVAKKWEFTLQHQEVDGIEFYCIKDWIAGLTGAKGLRANHIWWNYRTRHLKERPLSIRVLPYHGRGRDGVEITYDMDFTNDEGLYKLAMYLPVTKERPSLRAIKEFLAKAGVFVDEARRDPEGAAERLTTARRMQALRVGKSEEWVATREEGVITRKQFVSQIYALAQDKKRFPVIIATITNDVYRGVFHDNAQGLKARLGITSKENPRDHFSRIALSYTTIAEEAIRINLSQYEDYDYIPVPVMREVVQALALGIGAQADKLAEVLQIDILTGQRLLPPGNP